jgi:hypothetical protein
VSARYARLQYDTNLVVPAVYVVFSSVFVYNMTQTHGLATLSLIEGRKRAPLFAVGFLAIKLKHLDTIAVHGSSGVLALGRAHESL